MHLKVIDIQFNTCNFLQNNIFPVWKNDKVEPRTAMVFPGSCDP